MVPSAESAAQGAQPPVAHQLHLSDSGSQYSTSFPVFVAHSRVTRMPQMCKATSGEEGLGDWEARRPGARML